MKKDKVNFFKSIGLKIVVATILAVVLSNLVSIITLVKSGKSTLMDATQKAMISLAEAYGNSLNVSIAEKGTLTYDDYNSELLQAKGVIDLETSYAYLVDQNGTMMYHPTFDKVGKPVENSVVKGLVADIRAGKHPQPTCVSYLFKGIVKYASYKVLNDNSILVITADEDEVMANTNQTTKSIILLMIFIIVVFGVLAYVLSIFITRPLHKLTAVIQQTAKLDFTKSGRNALAKRGDETGVMARAVGEMRRCLREMVANIDEVSDKVDSNVEEVKNLSSAISSMCTDNSATTEELAAGMQETSATTETINTEIGTMLEHAGEIKKLSQSGEQLSYEIMERAKQLQGTTEEASKRTADMYHDVKEKTEIAINDSKAVDKINELTDAIMSISSQTSLLALNASIEAARAGEAGRGFAVVATEIGNLANQTSQTVGDINTIVKEVNNAVSKMEESLESTVQFLEDVVMKDYGQFKEVGDQYTTDADVIQNSMKNIEGAIAQLSGIISDIAESLNGINTTVNEATIGITDIAGKTSDVVDKSVQNNTYVDECKDSVERLKKIVDMFKVE